MERLIAALSLLFSTVSHSGTDRDAAGREELLDRIENARETLRQFEADGYPRQDNRYEVGQYYPPWYNWGNWNNWDNWPNYWNNWLNY